MDRASGPWAVRGVSAETRRKAKAEAAAAGLTLGQFVEEAIEKFCEPEKKSPKAEVEIYGLAHDTAEPVHLATVDSEGGVVEHEKPKARKSRVVCQHGVEKGYNCWQCGGLARIQ